MTEQWAKATVLSEALGQKLLAKGWRVTTAESCTGGGLACAITEVAGSSAWFDQGIVSYSNAVKADLLRVPLSTLSQHGAVSAPVVAAMAQGALHSSGSDLALSISGIAGPTGGSAEKPVGTVWFGLQDRHGEFWQKCEHFDGDRSQVRAQAIIWALQAMIDHLDVI